MAVRIVTDSEFMEEINEHPHCVVKFFTDWCGSCRQFRPKFIRLSDDDRFKGIRFLDVNAEQNPVARKLAGVTHFPTFAIIRNGKCIESIATSREELVVDLLQKLTILQQPFHDPEPSS